MWAYAAEEVTQGGDGLLAAVIGLASVAVGGVVTIVVSLINRSGKADAAQPVDPPVDDDDDDIAIRERVAILEHRADNWDRADELHDRRLDQVERVLDLENPRWRHRP